MKAWGKKSSTKKLEGGEETTSPLPFFAPFFHSMPLHAHPSVTQHYSLLPYTGIVYCFSRKDSVTIASSLMSRGIKAACYHGNLDGPSRSQVHRAWTSNSIQVIKIPFPYSPSPSPFLHPRTAYISIILFNIL